MNTQHEAGIAGSGTATGPYRFGFLLLFTLGALSAFGPLSMDLYLPALPELASALGATDALAQLTLGACMIGLALGQLVAGPLSDRFGRRAPLLVGVAAFVVFSIACAVAPSIEFLIVARLLQGLSGAAGIVIAMAVARDLAGASGTAGVLSILAGIMGIAPVAAPLAGGALMLVMDWRGLFVVLAGVGLVLLLMSARFVPESLPPSSRSAHGFGDLARGIGVLVTDWRFMAIALAMGLGSAVLFTYIQMSPLLFQGAYGLDAQQFALLFAVNSIGIVLVTQLNRLMLRRWRPRSIASVALAVAAAGSATVLVLSFADGTLWPILAVLFVVVSANGCVMANIATEALVLREGATGTAAALVGAFQFLIGAVVAPLASLAGTTTAVMSITMCAAALAALALILIGTAGRRRA